MGVNALVLFVRRNLKTNITAFFITFVLVVFILFIIIERNISPTLLAIAEARARLIATEAINEAIKNKIANNVSYKDMITIHKNINGEVTLIQINAVEVNRIESETALYISQALRKITMGGIAIPLGQVTGSQILANFGPRIKVSIIPVGTVEVDISEAFEEAGINQTRHKIFLAIKTWVKIVVPMVSSNVQVSTHIPIAETIIVGNVPNVILEFEKLIH